jgi:hypothetical protein
MARPRAGEPLQQRPRVIHPNSPCQAPPPTLRDILGAYKARGDGDRDMLIAMLNAKSAEDQVRSPRNGTPPVQPYSCPSSASQMSQHYTEQCWNCITTIRWPLHNINFQLKTEMAGITHHPFPIADSLMAIHLAVARHLTFLSFPPCEMHHHSHPPLNTLAKDTVLPSRPHHLTVANTTLQ